jgi:Helix-turn-helix of insertion element transposase
MKKDQETIHIRQERDKALMLDNLRKTPIVQAVCEKLNISRATYYRWRKEDKEFTKTADEALGDGSLLVNDLAESQLISAIKEKNMGAIIYWLRHHHPSYANKLIITHAIEDEDLTPEQEALVREGLRLANGVSMEISKINNVNNNNQNANSNTESGQQPDSTGVNRSDGQGPQSQDSNNQAKS